jgi:hypothetical protein
MINQFDACLRGGHPNSLGNTIEVVDEILQDKTKLQDLYDCYQSDNAVVRLRVSNGMKRVCKEHPDWVAEHLSGLTKDISTIDQASTKWTLATLYMWLDAYMTSEQRRAAIDVMKHNLTTELDWIVQNTTAESLAYFAKQNHELRLWLIPELDKQTHSKHKSLAKRAEKWLVSLS